MALTIVDKHGAFVNDWSIGKVLLGVHNSEEKCGDHREDEESNNHVVLVHVVVSLFSLGFTAAKHSCNNV